MRQFTTKAQTEKLMELGFPNPKAVVPETISAKGNIALYGSAYSIGELLLFIAEKLIYNINKTSGQGDDLWILMRWYPFDEVRGNELIDVLVKACIKFRKELL